MSIKSPYNFVPLSKSVFYPSWANDADAPISHDIPFEDGESGMIKLKITTMSPTFIRNHYEEGDEFFKQKKGEQKLKVSQEFCHIKKSDGSKQYYIPATSFKGMVRNILEISTFSRIQISKELLQKLLSVRDMTPKEYCLDARIRRIKDCPQNQKRDLFNHPLVATAQNCALLELKEDGTFTLYNSGRAVVIKHDVLEKDFDIRSLKEKNTAKEKYEEYGHKSIRVEIRNEGRQTKAYAGTSKEAVLVFTGDIKNKRHEFVFFKGKEIDVENNVVQEFKSTYFKDEDSIDGQYWKKVSKNHLIPVFYVLDRKKNITHLGLTQIFKVGYSKTLLQASKQNIHEGKLDFAETLFGTVEQNQALKGRVSFSHFKSNIIRFEKQPKKSVEQVLGSPNPTYYPNYIRQIDSEKGKVNKYATLMDENSQIAGWKVYPLQNTLQKYELPQDDNGKINHDVTTQWKPLGIGVEFDGVMRFHNLKKAEIGALLSALTFHMQGDKYLHNIGMAKPLGYGKIRVDITSFENFKHEKKEYLDAFESVMNEWSDKEYKEWHSSEQIRELFSVHNDTKANSLRYQQLKNSKGKNDFVEAKKSREFLQLHSKTSISKSMNEKKVVKEKPCSEKVKKSLQKKDKSYSMIEIAQESKVDIDWLLHYVQQPEQALPKDLTSSSRLNEAQAKGVINKLKKRDTM